MKVSDYIAERIYQAGITDVFMVTGGGAMHLDDSVGHHPHLRRTCHHHEQACAMAAEAYARYRNRPALVLVTTGPGATNAVTGVLCAWMESIPMLVISGQARFSTCVRSTDLPLRSMGIQEFDITPAVRTMTKYAAMIERKEDVPEMLDEALRVMMEGRRGPVWLDIPLDVQGAEIDADPAVRPETVCAHTETFPDETVEEILSRLSRAERPVIFGGYGIHASGGEELFRSLAEHLGIPVLTGMSSVDLIPEDHPLYAGRTGMTGTRSGNLAMAGCDLFLSVGSRLSFLQTGFDYREWAREAFTILNEIDPFELKKPNVRCDMPVIGDAAQLMRQLLSVLKMRGVSPENPLCRKASGWTERSVGRKYLFPAVTEAEKAPQKDGRVNIYRFYDMLSEMMPEGRNLLVSVGTARVAGTQAFRIKEGQRFFTNSSTASMGYCLPAAIGLARASGEEIVLSTGEGSLMMNLQELQTIATNHLPVRIFVICNEGYHSIRQTQNAWFEKPLIGIGPESGDLGFPAVEKLAYAFGLSYSCIRGNETIKEDMEASFRTALPSITEVCVTPLQNTEPKASARRLEDGTMVSVPLEDMSPFLDRKILSENLEIPLTEGELAR